MITFEEAQAIAFQSLEALGTEMIPFDTALYRVLAENIITKEFFPPFDKSAMDGYACRKEDLSEPMEVIETIPAGTKPIYTIGKNQCAKIMTGAMIPDGADTVIIKEKVQIWDENHIIFNDVFSSTNICYKGEDAEEDEVMLVKGTKLEAQHLAVLATLGQIRIMVYKLPRIGVLVTGSELVEPHETIRDTQIRNSNAYSILNQLKQERFHATYYGIVSDQYQLTTDQLLHSIKNNEVLIMSGAVSVGDFDFVPQILKENGFEILFHGLHMKPGKRLLFAKKDKKWVIGLPGNPVSTFVQMQEFAIPFLYKLMGCIALKPPIFLPLDHVLERKNGDKKEFIPVQINASGKVNKVAYNGSGNIQALIAADGLMEFPMGKNRLEENERVRFISF